MASNEFRTPMERSQKSSSEEAPFKPETPGAVDKRRVIFSKGVLPNIKFRVPIILFSPFLKFCVESDLAFFLRFFFFFQCKQKKKTCEYQNICNCNIFLGEVVHYLTEVQGCQYFCHDCIPVTAAVQKKLHTRLLLCVPRLLLCAFAVALF